MAIAPTIEKYLAKENIEYDVISHDPTGSSMDTAEVCHVPGDRLAKGVVVRNGGGYILAVVPATHHIQLAELKRQLGFDVDLATEHEIEQLFRDCALGAIPPVGECYGLDMIVDESFQGQPDVYLEGGDHATLIHMNHAQFARLTTRARHGRFSAHV
jgi:Ala-tRNA(Pro) deacylase